jgi:hypothetical protein
MALRGITASYYADCKSRSINTTQWFYSQYGYGHRAMLAEIPKLGSSRLWRVESSESAVRLARSQGLDVRLDDASADLVTLFEQHSFYRRARKGRRPLQSVVRLPHIKFWS